MITLGCARNEVDSEELAADLARDGWDLVPDPQDADTVLVNTCGFIEAAKRDSIDVVLDAAELPGKVVAVGCMAERYGEQLQESLPEADAVLGFDAYRDLPRSLRKILAGEHVPSHTPHDRRRLQPSAPVDRSADLTVLPGHIGVRRRLSEGAVASVKLASGCDRRCTFCAIPSFRGAFVSRRPTEVIDEVAWLVDQGVLEVNLVSENSTSYGKDLGDLRLLESLLLDLAGTPGLERVRVAYLQPAEMRPDLVRIIGSTVGVAPYFDLSFQHASPEVLRRMRRFGGRDDFLALIDQIRDVNPAAAIRSNFIVGFPGETPADVDVLVDFLNRARLDAVGVFGYSDEEGTQAVDLPEHLDADEIDVRVDLVAGVADEVMGQRAAQRVGESVRVLVDAGKTQFQGPEDGSTRLVGSADAAVVVARVVDSEGADLVAEIS
ncbi:MAG: MiaB/RimO family radical SAM methylthiotransferase [Actinobacteria bacterium]|nr:MiaB/RimO family radical SAM methylthiotransferase [Actinomycetota bacterium]MCB8995819.1 MiaB/RimO family radical SAM methylthiotransferase [Actinomycetota bacterium]MCB9415582.1 MiaB/RimO family radical SAM methylthiotransferase [Actinomycetota bacterium]